MQLCGIGLELSSVEIAALRKENSHLKLILSNSESKLAYLRALQAKMVPRRGELSKCKTGVAGARTRRLDQYPYAHRPHVSSMSVSAT